jgi:hypothetical protein
MLGHARRWILAVAASAALVIPVAAVLPSASALASSCAQPTHVWIATPAGSLANGNEVALAPLTSVYPVGVVQPGTSIYFFTPSQSALGYRTGNAGGNCVVNQPSQSNAPVIGFVPAGTYPVDATYTPWESGTQVTTLVGYIVVS